VSDPTLRLAARQQGIRLANSHILTRPATPSISSKFQPGYHDAELREGAVN